MVLGSDTKRSAGFSQDRLRRQVRSSVREGDQGDACLVARRMRMEGWVWAILEVRCSWGVGEMFREKNVGEGAS